MKLTTTTLSVLGLSLLLVACGDDGPDMKAGFAADMPPGWALESFKITASEDVGTKVSPVSQHRFVAEVSPSEDLFEKVATLHGKDILKRVFEKGSEVEVHGVGVAAFTAGKWEALYQIEKAPFMAGGQPAKAFGANHVVVGSSEFRSLVTSATEDLDKLQTQSDKLAADIQQKSAELQAASAEAQKQINESSAKLARIQQEAQAKQSAEYQAYNQKVQEIKNKYGAEFNSKRTTLVAAFNEKKKSLYEQSNANIKLIRAERTEAVKWRQTERRRVYATYNAAITDARRKKLDAASFATVKADADAKARAAYAAIDEQTQVKTADTKERESKAMADYRTEIGTLQSDSQEAVKAATDEITANRDAELEEEKKKYEAAVAASSAELNTARTAHNALVQSANGQQRQISTEIANMRNQISNNGRNIQSVKEVLTFLESARS